MQVVNTNKNNIFCFWESDNDMPGYLKLCLKSWKINIKNSEVHVINYNNIYSYLEKDKYYDIDLLRQIRLPMQSDIISAAILEKFGGLFMDVDCIVTANIFDIFNQISSEKLIGFGRIDKKNMHLAVLYSKKANNPIFKKWRQEAQVRLKNIPNNMSWSYFGNSILNPILGDDNLRNEYHIIDRSLSGNILESTIFSKFDKHNPEENYKEFYFNEFIEISNEALKLVTCGVISLHNSWTPIQYKKIYDTDTFLRTDISLAKFLNFILYSNKYNRLSLKNSLALTEVYLENILHNYNIQYQKKYFNKYLVFDFNIKNNLFAFDILYDNKKGDLSLFLVLRNININQLLKLNVFPNLIFNKNNSLILQECEKEELAKNMIKIIKSIEELVDNGMILTSISGYEKEDLLNNNLLKDNIFMNIFMLKMKDSKLFLKGEAFIIGSNIKEYSDINYILELKGQKKYEFSLAKEHSPELTQKYSNSSSVSYDKCIVTTYGNNGIDVSGLLVGRYELFLRIENKNLVKKQKLRSDSILEVNTIEIKN